MIHWGFLFLALWVGAIVGFFVAAMCQAAKGGDYGQDG